MGGQLSFLSEAFPPKPTFKAEDIPDLTAKVIIVTGGNTGIGKETVKVLLNRNAKVYMASRNKQRAQEAIADLKLQTGKEAHFLELDLANLKAIKTTVETFLSLETELHVLFNNGGVMFPPIEQLTADGYDLQFGTNVIGHYYFTTLLLPALTATAKSTNSRTRVITSSSSGHWFSSGIDYETLRDGPKRKALGSSGLYIQSKFGNVVFATEVARRYADQGIVSISCNPGNINSDLYRHLPSIFRRIMELVWLHPTSEGALTQLWGGVMPDTEEFNGKYLIPWARLGSVRRETQDSAAGEELWSWLEAQVKDL